MNLHIVKYLVNTYIYINCTVFVTLKGYDSFKNTLKSKTGIFLTSLSTGSLASAGSKGLFFTSGNSTIDTSFAGSLTSVGVGEG